MASRIAAGVAEQEPTSESSRRRTGSKSIGTGSVSQAKTRSVPPGASAASASSRPAWAQRTTASTGAVLRRGAVAERELEPVRERIGREDVVAAADERLREKQPGEPAADDEHAPSRDPLDRPQNAGEWLGERSDRVVDPVGERDRLGSAGALGEAAGDNRRRREALARRLVAGAAAVALAARQVVDERDAVAFPVLGDDLVPENGAGSRAADLLDVRPAEAAGAHGHERAVPVGLGPVGDLRLPRLIQHHRSHRGNRRGGTPLDCDPRGAIAQLGERLDRTQEVAGSSPASSMTKGPQNGSLQVALPL